MPSTRMKIVADDRIPYVEEAFGPLGDLVTLPGRRIDNAVLKDAAMLLTRSITQVDRGLLEATAVRFVGTATIGFDHIDLDYLSQAGIGFASAAGCNANAVGQYIATVLLELATQGTFQLAGTTLGVIGVGHVGSKVVRYAKALGMKVLENDPPRERVEGAGQFVGLEQICREADVITLHVPLTEEGPDATRHLFDAARLAQLRDGVVLINSSRGPVVDNAALLAELSTGRLAAVLDVWEGEPDICTDLLKQPGLRFGTPHVAGYSFEGKITATQMIRAAACHHFGLDSVWDSSKHRQPPADSVIAHVTTLIEAVRHAYDIRADHRAMTELLIVPPDLRGRQFDRLRNEYRFRREFENYHVARAADRRLEELLTGLGFRVGK